MQLLRLKDVLKIVPVSKATWYNILKHPNSPKTYKAGGVSFWEKSEIEFWIKEHCCVSDKNKSISRIKSSVNC